MASRTIPRTAQKAATQLITGALWNAGPYAMGNFMLNVPVFRGVQNASQAVASNVWTPMFLQSETIDTDNGHSNVTNNPRYTCQVPGWYYIEGYIALNSGQPASRVESAIAKNSTIVPGSCQFLLRQNDLQSLMTATFVQLAVNDFVEVWGRQQSAGSLNTFAGTDLCPCMNLFWVHS